jgi:16S rRNA processing protein RimM
MPSTAQPDPNAFTWLARIRHTQGRKGEVLSEILTDFPERFADRTTLTLLNPAGTPLRTVNLINHWLHKGHIVLHFEGIDSITAAEALNGLIVAIPTAERAPLADDEFYISDLIGCTLIDCASGSEKEIGTITDVDRSSGPVPLLVLAPASGPKSDEKLIPFAKAWLKHIDLPNHRLLMSLPEGLTDL